MRHQRMLRTGRQMAEERMTDTCTVGVEREGDTLDPATGQYVREIEAAYEGPCRFKQAASAVGEINAAGQTLIEQDAELSVPVLTSTMIRKGMLVVVTSSMTDPALVGVRALVKGPSASSQRTARRFSVEQTE
jgi:hypothetical protein